MPHPFFVYSNRMKSSYKYILLLYIALAQAKAESSDLNAPLKIIYYTKEEINGSSEGDRNHIESSYSVNHGGRSYNQTHKLYQKDEEENSEICIEINIK